MRTKGNYDAPNKYSQRALNPFLPPRPKKPPGPFSLFMKDYSVKYRQNPEHTAAKARFVRVCRDEWNKLSNKRKEEFSVRAEAEKGIRERPLQLWYKMRNMLRKPPNVYCIYTKETWANKDPNDESTMAEFSIQIWDDWYDMDAAEKAPYFQRYAELLARHQEMLRALEVGGNIIPFLEDGEDYELEEQDKQGGEEIAGHDANGGQDQGGQ